MPQLFDCWPDTYERWFQTPIGKLVMEIELELVLRVLFPQPGEHILDAGCGSGIFTSPIAERGARITGVDLSSPMLKYARSRLPSESFLVADMNALSFADCTFDKAVSITALEFIQNGEQALAELFRVTCSGGWVVVATLNSLSPWAIRRKAKAEKDKGSVFNQAWFRNPEELMALTPVPGHTSTAVHFSKDSDPGQAQEIERQGQVQGLNTGAFLVGSWQKP